MKKLFSRGNPALAPEWIGHSDTLGILSIDIRLQGVEGDRLSLHQIAQRVRSHPQKLADTLILRLKTAHGFTWSNGT